MGVFKRISDIVSANFNELIEDWEDPEKMLKQAIREMEVTIDESKHSVAKAMASEKLVARELRDNQRRADEWLVRAERAVRAGDDVLARKALARKQESEKIASALLDQHLAAEEASTTLRRQLEVMQARLAEAKRHLGTLTARKKAADVRARIQVCRINPQLNTDAFAKFHRLREKVEMAEAEAAALCELSVGDPPAREMESAISAMDLDVDAELVALKASLAK